MSNAPLFSSVVIAFAAISMPFGTDGAQPSEPDTCFTNDPCGGQGQPVCFTCERVGNVGDCPIFPVESHECRQVVHATCGFDKVQSHHPCKFYTQTITPPSTTCAVPPNPILQSIFYNCEQAGPNACGDCGW